MALSVQQSSGGVISSLDAGSITSGAANQVICDSGALAAGNSEPIAYLVSVVSLQGGTVDGNLSNMLCNVGGANGGGIISGGTTIGKLSSTSVISPQRYRVNVQPGQHIYVCAGNATPGAGSIYIASLVVTRLPYPLAAP